MDEEIEQPLYLPESGRQVAVMRRGQPTADAVREVLGIQNKKWSSVEVRIGTGGVATATVVYMINKAQAIALIETCDDMPPRKAIDEVDDPDERDAIHAGPLD